MHVFTSSPYHLFAQSAEAVEYTDNISAEGNTPPPKKNVCPAYDTKQSDGEVPVILELGECGIPL